MLLNQIMVKYKNLLLSDLIYYYSGDCYLFSGHSVVCRVVLECTSCTTADFKMRLVVHCHSVARHALLKIVSLFKIFIKIFFIELLQYFIINLKRFIFYFILSVP